MIVGVTLDLTLVLTEGPTVTEGSVEICDDSVVLFTEEQYVGSAVLKPLRLEFTKDSAASLARAINFLLEND